MLTWFKSLTMTATLRSARFVRTCCSSVVLPAVWGVWGADIQRRVYVEGGDRSLARHQHLVT